jgi:Flp pilus assembly protein TadG
MTCNSQKSRIVRRLLRLGNDERGPTAVEFALVMMAFFAIVFAIIDFGRLFQSWTTLQHAARQGSRYALTGRIDCLDNNGTPVPTATPTTARLLCVQYITQQNAIALTGAPAAVTVTVNSWPHPGYLTPVPSSTPTPAPTPNSAGGPCGLVEVRAQYTHVMIVPIIKDIVPQVSLSTREQAVNEPFAPGCGP